MFKTRGLMVTLRKSGFFVQVSVRRDVPQTVKDLIQEEPEDWTLAFPEVKLQIFFLIRTSATSNTTILCPHSMNCPFKNYI